ncbi:hypothetical protein WJX84_003662 [Apatococcus fuscideae]|uniref:Uncharacterized protein n=1 Tax=Apatococcus fuscideae TaxID=2026836 RepID=A0AAW1SVH9_9CHLO
MTSVPRQRSTGGARSRKHSRCFRDASTFLRKAGWWQMDISQAFSGLTNLAMTGRFISIIMSRQREPCRRTVHNQQQYLMRWSPSLHHRKQQKCQAEDE